MPRYFYFKAYDIAGKEIYSGKSGCWHGCGSLDVDYYPNGAVKYVKETFQPDGGIQHYDVRTHFDELGKVTKVDDYSLEGPGRTHLVSPTIEDPIVKPKPKVKVREPKKDKLELRAFFIKNSTSKRLTIILIDTLNKQVLQHVRLRKNELVFIDSVEVGMIFNLARSRFQVLELRVSKRKTIPFFSTTQWDADVKRLTLYLLEKDE